MVCTAVGIATLISGGPVAWAGISAGTYLAGTGAEAVIASSMTTGFISGSFAGTATTTIAGGTAISSLSSACVGGVAGLSAGGAITSGNLAARKGGDFSTWIICGTSNNPYEGDITYDCWKPVVHDYSSEPSKGILLNELMCHPNILKTTVSTLYHSDLPNVVIENIWDEVFEIEYLLLQTTGDIVCHAAQI